MHRAELLGDAIHLMTPDLGQGACQAMVDAVTLAGCLVGYRHAVEALARSRLGSRFVT